MNTLEHLNKLPRYFFKNGLVVRTESGPWVAYEAVYEVAQQAYYKADLLRTALLVLLDQVDYTAGACALTEMVGACLPVQAIERARKALKETQ